LPSGGANEGHALALLVFTPCLSDDGYLIFHEQI
jgi:hypothetical protein